MPQYSPWSPYTDRSPADLGLYDSLGEYFDPIWGYFSTCIADEIPYHICLTQSDSNTYCVRVYLFTRAVSEGMLYS